MPEKITPAPAAAPAELLVSLRRRFFLHPPPLFRVCVELRQHLIERLPENLAQTLERRLDGTLTERRLPRGLLRVRRVGYGPNETTDSHTHNHVLIVHRYIKLPQGARGHARVYSPVYLTGNRKHETTRERRAQWCARSGLFARHTRFRST